ncbi:MAG: GTP-binding protein, partial [bacterium]
CHVLALVDCANWGLIAANRELIERQVTFADVIILNKTDQVDERIIASIESDLAGLSPKAVLIRASHARVDLAPLLAIPAAPPQLPSTEGLHPITTVGFHTLLQRFDGPIDRTEFEASLAALPAGVVRAKGFVRFHGEDQTYLVQVVGNYRKLYRFDVPEGTPLEVVYIGPHVSDIQ